MALSLILGLIAGEREEGNNWRYVDMVKQFLLCYVVR